VLAAADVSGGGKLDRGEFFKFLLANKVTMSALVAQNPDMPMVPSRASEHNPSFRGTSITSDAVRCGPS
jgi:hypothetical protein